MKITKDKRSENQYRLDTTFTKGKLLALRNALVTYSATSTLGDELLMELDRALKAEGILPP
jgi:hypothetical protein